MRKVSPEENSMRSKVRKIPEHEIVENGETGLGLAQLENQEFCTNKDEKKKKRDSWMVPFVGVASTQLFAWAFWMNSKVFFIMYVVYLVPLLLYRWFDYSKKYWIHFCFDFCYVANAAMVIYVVLQVQSDALFMIGFSWCNCFVGFGSMVYRNQLSFSSLDRMTSTFIHVIPMLIMYSIRWFDVGDLFRICRAELEQNDCFSISKGLWWLHFYPACAYLAYIVVFFIWIEVLPQSRLQRHPEYTNSCNFLMERFYVSNISFIRLLLKTVPKKYHKQMFYWCQFIALLLSSIPCMIYYRYQIANTAYVLIVLADCIRSAAVSQTKYLAKVKKIRRQSSAIVSLQLGNANTYVLSDAASTALQQACKASHEEVITLLGQKNGDIQVYHLVLIKFDNAQI